MSETNTDDSREQSDWVPKHNSDSVYDSFARMMGPPMDRIWVHRSAPVIQAMHLHPDRLCISVEPEIYPDEESPPSVPVKFIDDVQEDEVEETLADVDMLPLLAEKYNSTINNLTEEITGDT